MEIDWDKACAEALEELQRENPDAIIRKAELWELRYSGRHRKLQDYFRDGIEINGTLTLYSGIPFLHVDIPYDDIEGGDYSWLTLEAERFVLFYLFTGKGIDAPIFYLKREEVECWADKDYIYRHLRRERNREALIYTEVEDGIKVIAYYPYGSIDYGVLPHSREELDLILDNTESNPYECAIYDIEEIHSNKLPREERAILEDKFLDSVFPNGIPTNIILDKTVCGIGATHLEIEKAQRHSIIIEPNVPVIIGKERDHPQVIGVYGGKIDKEELEKMIGERIGKEFIKILTTPESFRKVIKALNSLGKPYRDTFFLLFDECDRIITDVDFREEIALPMDEFFQFANKAMVSATPIIIDEPRFKEHNFSVIKIIPDYSYIRPVELKPTTNVRVMLKRTLEKLETETAICIFYNYVDGITKMIEFLKIPHQDVSIYCSESARKELKKEGWEKNVFGNLQYEKKKVKLTTKYNFFTSRYYSAVDIKLDCKPAVIMLSVAYKSSQEKTPFTLIEPETEAIQIAGRFRNGVSRLIHIAGINSEMEWRSKEDLKEYLEEQHLGHLKLRELE